MSDFEPAYQRTRTNEGGYANVKNDRGGETYAGIARSRHPQWPGWTIVDQVKAATPMPPAEAVPNSAGGSARVYGLALQYRLWVKELNSALAARGDLQQMIRNFYLANFWRYGGVQNQDVANKLFDLSVYKGPEEACKIAQRSANCQACQLTVDGGYGPITEKGLNLCNAPVLLNDMRRLAAKLSTDLAGKDPSQLEFLKDWLMRDAQ
jgi:lysozyme family protein